ncbi:putative hydro-lyase [Cupriavidus sp. L7L]|uniref:putative hydro-lyase n=1 Tax=Cupriavidus sp. L7L TaxID=2546443 RepID=UPI001FB821FA|nr:putative hydro-lyase [Cupriavidus sp. L7L]
MTQVNAGIDALQAVIRRTDLATMSPQQVRLAIRSSQWTGTTHGASRGRLQANLVVLSARYAFDFLRFCLRNPSPCPVIDVTNPGDPEPKLAAPGADVRTDLSRYKVYRDGQLVEERSDLTSVWRDDSVAFLLGCSLSFDEALDNSGIAMPHLHNEDGRVATYRSGIACQPAGPFSGPMVVTMRPVPTPLVARAVQVTSRYPLAHGAPVHIGDPSQIGIHDLQAPEFVKFGGLPEGHTPVFWGCGVTPQAVALAAGVPEMFTHAAGHMFVTDLTLDGWQTKD